MTRDPDPDLVDVEPPSFAIPVIILGAAIVVSLLGGTVQLARDSVNLAAANQAQAQVAQDGDRIRRQLDALMAGTAALAGQGNASAKSVLDTLARQGVNYTPPK